MAKRRLDVNPGSLSDDSGDKKSSDEAKISVQALRAKSRAAVNKLQANPPKKLSDVFDEATLGINPSWFMYQTNEQWLEILNAYSTQKERYLISFTQLGEIASLSRVLYVLFQDTDYKNWRRCAEIRTSGKLKFTYVPAYLNKRRHPNFEEPVYGALIAYLNLFGLGHCPECGMYPNFSAKTLEKDDYITVSPFRQMTAAEVAAFPGYNDSKLYDKSDFAPKPQHLMNLLIIRDGMKGAPYCCINCLAPLNKSICGLPACAVPEACNSRSNGRAKHLWVDLENDLVAPEHKVLKDGIVYVNTIRPVIKEGKTVMVTEKRPHKVITEVTVPGKVIKQIFMQCIRCGILKLQGDEDDSNTCPHCDEDEDENGVCGCEPCSLCTKMPKLCKCIVCDVADCMKCKTEDCSKLCQKDPCLCDVSSSSEEETSSSEESSSDGF
jgi:hypothetical protein